MPMRNIFTSIANRAPAKNGIVLPAAFVVTSAVYESTVPVLHSLGIASVSWGLTATWLTYRVGLRIRNETPGKRKLAVAAGLLFVFALVCERAATHKQGVWWAKALLPIALITLLRPDGRLAASSTLRLEDNSTPKKSWAESSATLTVLATIAAAAVLNVPFVASQTTALGVSGVAFTALSLSLLHVAIREDDEEETKEASLENGSTGSRPTAGLLNGLDRIRSGSLPLLRDFSIVVAIICVLGSMRLETFQTGGITIVPTDYDADLDSPDPLDHVKHHWKIVPRALDIPVWIVFIGALRNTFLLLIIQLHGPLFSAFLLLGACLLAGIRTCSVWELWFTVLFFLAAGAVLEDTTPVSSAALGQRSRMRLRQAITSLGFASVLVFCLTKLHNPGNFTFEHSGAVPLDIQPLAQASEPLQPASTRAHPVDQLIRNAEADFSKTLESQSKSLAEAVAEYRRRYQLPPPPNFDKWYQFAMERDVQLIDEFDTIHQLLLPFWALEPKTVRARVREALGYEDNSLITVFIRDGETAKIDGGREWFQKAMIGMLKNFVQYLPDMDLALNVHDEPRVVVPHDDLSRIIRLAKDERTPVAFANKIPRNSFSPRPADLPKAPIVVEAKTTRFNRFSRQSTWSHSKASCSPDSPARDLEDAQVDNRTAYALGDLGFLYNQTAFSDICLSPSFSSTYGFFDRPNAFSVSADLVPIFSQSKISSYQDILYPSPWYWYGKVEYEEDKDMEWDKKDYKFYWRGSTTGGYSRNGGWRRHHRQRFVQKINEPGIDRVLKDKSESDEPDWQTIEVQRGDFQDSIDVKFSHVGQCDPGDCDAQAEFFEIAKKADQQDAWRYKYLLDLDGNAFSGRFYAFLKSQSLVYKMAVFQEWHKDWLKPWAHYVPLSLKGDEWLESVRYFAGEDEGKIQAPRLAQASSQWAKKALRNEDLEVWFFRLLLEYGRIIDDNRDSIGFPGQ